MSSASMPFSATFACPRCRLRFARRARCPECGGATAVSLATVEGRARYRARAGSSLPPTGLAHRLGHGAPRRPLPVIAAGLLMMLPALAEYPARLASDGIWRSALGAVGGVVVVLSAVAALARARTAGAAPVIAARTRVLAPAEGARGETSLTGIARRASVTVTSAVARMPCIAFGLQGACGGADVADAEGGDFDLELSSGERVLVSLEHAVLEASEPHGADPTSEVEASPVDPDKPAEELDDVLGELLASRGIEGADGRAPLREHLLREGDEITVIGTVLGGTVTSLDHRGARGARVLAGDEERPLVVRLGRGDHQGTAERRA